MEVVIMIMVFQQVWELSSGKYYWEMKKGSGSGGALKNVITEDVDVRLGNRATSSPDSNLWGFQSNGQVRL